MSRLASTDRPQAGFDRFDLRAELRRALADAEFSEPRPIQVAALPAGLRGRDVLGLAQTGTGKTVAFALPILQRLLDSNRPGPRALVVAPTRELASQVHAEFERLARHTKIRATVVFGGVPISRQVRALSQRPDIVVACPGRLLDLLGQGALRLDRVEVLVLDEADHMFDMGFLPDVRRILRALPQRRQNLLFSATMPPEIRKLADTVLNKPEVIELGGSRPAETIAHALYPLAETDKVGALESLIARDDFRSAIVFLRTKRRAKRLAERLSDRGASAVALQGNMSQSQRERALEGFREGRYAVLVATDIAARGLDIAGVSHVINFDVPNTPDAYTHRIGRTGRSEQTGTAFTFVTPDDSKAVRAIEQRLGGPIERRPVAELGGALGHASLNSSTGRRARPQPAARSRKPAHPRAPAHSRAPARPRAPAPRDAGQRTNAPRPAQPKRPEQAFGVGVMDASAREHGKNRGRPAGGPRPVRRKRRRPA